MDSEESQFVPQSGDEENLWEILGIIAEKGNKYKVKWVGEDPKTGKPWGNSWVKKSDVTPDVVDEWKGKQAHKARRKSLTKSLSKPGSKKSTGSAERAASTSTVTARRSRGSVASTVKQAWSPSASRSPPPPASISASPRKTTGKRKLAVVRSPNSSSDFELPDILSVLQGVREGSEPQKKKRKVSEEVAEAQPRASTSASKTASSSKRRRSEGAEQTTSEFKHVQPEDEDEEQEQEQEERITAKLTKAGSSRDVFRTKPDATRTKGKPSDAKVVATSNAKGKGRAAVGGKGRGKKPALVILSEDDDDEGSGTEVMNQLTQNAQLSESDEDDSEPPPTPKESKLKSKSKARASNVTQPKPGQASKAKPIPNRASTKSSSTGVVDADETELEGDQDSLTKKVDTTATPRPDSTKPDPLLTPWTLQRLEEFDESMRRLDEEDTTGSERAAAVPYGESDVDSVAVDIMYPPPEEATGTSKQKGRDKPRALEREATLLDEVPEILVQPTASPPPLPFCPIPGTPSRSSLKSKMRPRTPRSGAGSLVSFADIPEAPAMDLGVPAVEPAPTKVVNGTVNGTSKPQSKPTLGPIPQISPSKFYPHLPKPSLDDTTIDDAEPEVEEPMSSIEQFESPEKSAHVRVVPAPPNGAKGKGKAREQSPVEDDEFWAGDIVLSVEQMREREAQKQAEKRRQEQSTVPKRRTLEEVIQQHLSAKADSDRASTESRSLSKSPTPPPPPPEETPGDDYDDFYVDEPTENQDTQMEQEEETPLPPPVHLPEEEEESTQDLLHELEVQQAVSQPAASPSPEPDLQLQVEPEPKPEPEPELEPELLEEPVQDAEESFDVSMEPQIGTQGVSLEYPPGEDEPETQPPPPGQARGVEGTQEIPPTLSTHQDESSQESNKTNASIDSTDQKKHISYMNLLNAKSEEISELSKQLQDERSQKEQFASRVAALEEQLRLAQISAAESQKAATDDLAQKLEESNTKSAAAMEALAVEREAWGQQQKSLQNQIDAIEGQNNNVLTMFREANGRAEGFLREKKALNKELEIAQKQAKEAVGAQKAFFEKKLEVVGARRDELSRMSVLLTERDDRSKKHHHKRQYFAEVEELRGRLRSVKGRNMDLTKQLRKAEKANAALKLQLNGQWQEHDSGTDRDGSGSPEGSHYGRSQPPEDDLSDHEDVPRSQPMVRDEEEGGGESSEEDPEDEVIRCTWRKEDNKMCNALFKTQAKLEAHVFDAGHLPRPSSPLDGLD